MYGQFLNKKTKEKMHINIGLENLTFEINLLFQDLNPADFSA
jgi:hypothetical protein